MAQQHVQPPKPTTPASLQSNDTKPANGFATNGHAKVEGKSLKDRISAPGAKTDPLPAKPADTTQTPPGRKQKISKAATPVSNGDDTPTPATSDLQPSTTVEKSKASEDVPQKDVAKPAKETRERKDREPRDLKPRSRGVKGKDDKSQATSDVNGGPSEDATLPGKPSAAATDEIESSEKPTPSSTPRPPTFTLFIKGLPKTCSEDEVKPLWDGELRSKVCGA